MQLSTRLVRVRTATARLAGVAAVTLLMAPALFAAPDPLPTPVRSALDRAKVPREQLAVWVQEVGNARPRVAWQAEAPVNPASLMKLLTTGAALDLLGPAWTWGTPVWLQGRVHDGVLDGNLVIKGTGDPQLVMERLWLLLRRVQQLGVKDIRGDIVLDRSAFQVPAQDPSDFDGEGLRAYNVGADALLLNYRALVVTVTPDPANGRAQVSVDPPMSGFRFDASVPLVSGPCADWKTSLAIDATDPQRLRLAGRYPAACGEQVFSTAYADPAHYDERALTGMWQEMGGRLSGTVHEGSAPATASSFVLNSPPLAAIVRDINKYSNNVMAQQLFLTLGATQGGSGTPAAARAVLTDWVRQRIGPDAASALVVDNGSGLSRDGRVSAYLFSRLLQQAWASPTMAELMSSLPVSGVDGTLKRSRGAAGQAHLKTGTLRDVVGIAGYVLGDSGRYYVVVAIANGPQATLARPALDALVQWTAHDEAPSSGQTQ